MLHIRHKKKKKKHIMRFKSVGTHSFKKIPNLNLGFIKIRKNHNWRIINSINHVL